MIFDEDVLKSLKSLCPEDNTGAFLNNSNPKGQDTQIRYMEKELSAIDLTNILETGTNKGLFCFFVLSFLQKATIDTFDMAPYSKEAVRILNQRYGDKIRYIEGDSAQTLTSFRPSYVPDVAWIDGSHEYYGCLSDLKNCNRLGIRSIFVDDYRLLRDVRSAVDFFCKAYAYRIEGTDDLKDDRGIVKITPVR